MFSAVLFTPSKLSTSSFFPSGPQLDAETCTSWAEWQKNVSGEPKQLLSLPLQSIAVSPKKKWYWPLGLHLSGTKSYEHQIVAELSNNRDTTEVYLISFLLPITNLHQPIQKIIITLSARKWWNYWTGRIHYCQLWNYVCFLGSVHIYTHI